MYKAIFAILLSAAVLSAYPARAQLAEACTFLNIGAIRQGLNEALVGVQNAAQKAALETRCRRTCRTLSRISMLALLKGWITRLTSSTALNANLQQTQVFGLWLCVSITGRRLSTIMAFLGKLILQVANFLWQCCNFQPERLNQ